MLFRLTRCLAWTLSNTTRGTNRNCHNMFGIKNLIQQERTSNFTILSIGVENHKTAVDVIKKYYLNEHVLVRTRNMDLTEDRALDEYIVSLLRQGNSLYAKAEDDSLAGICVSFACSPIDSKNLRNYAFYRQDINTKQFLYFIAKLQETPNLWNIFKQTKIFEIKMLVVLPEHRRQGLAVSLVERAREQARDQGYHVIRMDCINSYDYRIAERCVLKCLVKYPLYKLRGPNVPFVKRNSDRNCFVRVYVDAYAQLDTTQRDLEETHTQQFLE